MVGNVTATASNGKLEVFDLIAEDDSTESYLARWNGSTWIVLRRGRSEAATRGIAEYASVAQRIVDLHVVRTFDPGDTELKGAVLLEQYLEGERLSDWLVTLETAPLPWRVAVAIVRDAALGAYAVQVACGGHPAAARELWPGRLVIGFDGSVRIVDPCAELRGAAAPAAVRERYGAPEADAATPEQGHAAVFVLGRILAELRAPTAATGDDFVPPKAFDRILQRATAAVATERYRNASELAVSLDALLDDPEPVRVYFENRFAAQRQAHAQSLTALGESDTATLEARGLDADGTGDAPSGFTDEVRTAVMLREVPSAPATIQELPDEDLPDYDESSDTEEIRLDALLGSYAADADEDIRTRPFRRELIAKLKRTERVVLGKGAERVAVVSTPVQPARTGSATPAENIIIDVPPGTASIEHPAVGGQSDATTDGPRLPIFSEEVPMALGAPNSEGFEEEAPLHDASVVQAALEEAAHTAPTVPRKMPPRRPAYDAAPNSSATVMIRAIEMPRSRTRDFVVLAIATVIVAGGAFWFFAAR